MENQQIRKFGEIEQFIQEHPQEASSLAAQWSTFLKENPQAQIFKTSQEWYEWVRSQPEKMIDPDLWVCHEVALALALARPPEIDQPPPQQEQYSELPTELIGLSLSAFLKTKTTIMGNDQRYLKIANSIQKDWLKNNPGKNVESDEWFDFINGTEDGKPSELHQKAEEEFRKQYPEKAAHYDKIRNKIHDNPLDDPHFRNTQWKINQHAGWRYNRLKSQKKEADFETVKAKIAKGAWDEFIQKHPEKAAAYAEKIKALPEEQRKNFNHFLDAHEKAQQRLQGTGRRSWKERLFGQKTHAEQGIYGGKHGAEGTKIPSEKPKVSFFNRSLGRGIQGFNRFAYYTNITRHPVEAAKEYAKQRAQQEVMRYGGKLATRAGARLAAPASRLAMQAAARAGAYVGGLAIGAVGWPVIVGVGVFIILLFIIIALAGSGGGPGAPGGPGGGTGGSPGAIGTNGCPDTSNNRSGFSCQYLNPSIDIFDTNISQDALNRYVDKYSPIFIRAGKGDKAEFTNRAQYIVSASRQAGMNPALILGYWKTETLFGTVGSRELGCAGNGFHEQVDCSLGINKFSDPARNPIANCARSRDKDSTACKALKSIRTRFDTTHPINYPIASFDDFAEAYGPYDHLNSQGLPSNCTHTYNELIEIAKELGACNASPAPTNTSPAPSGTANTPPGGSTPPGSSSSTLQKILDWDERIVNALLPGYNWGASGNRYNKLIDNITNAGFSTGTWPSTGEGNLYWCTYSVADAYNLAGINGVNKTAHAAVVTMRNFWRSTGTAQYNYDYIDYPNDNSRITLVEPGYAMFMEKNAGVFTGSEHVAMVRIVSLDSRGNGYLETNDSNSLSKTHRYPVTGWQVKNTPYPVRGFGGL